LFVLFINYAKNDAKLLLLYLMMTTQIMVKIALFTVFLIPQAYIPYGAEPFYP